MIKIAKEKTNAVLLLIGMTIFSVGVVFVVDQFRGDEYVLANENPQESIVVEDTLPLANETDTTIPQKVTQDQAAMVLSSSGTGVNSCLPSQVEITSYSFCTKDGAGDVDYKEGSRSGDLVSKNTKVTLVTVYVPLELFSGSNVKDSNRKITTKTPIYKPAGEQIDEKIANTLLIPGEQINDYKSSVQNKPFSSRYSLSFGQNEGTPAEEGKVVVDEKLINDCEQCRNKSNPNPDKSNKISTFMKDTLYRTPGEKEQLAESEGIEACSNEDKFIEWESTNRKACAMDKVTVAIELIKKIPSALWDECTIAKLNPATNEEFYTANCIDPEKIIIKMSSVFGSDEECLDGICTNSYMNTRNKIALSPEDSSKESGKVYYTTPCQVIVDGKTKPYTVKCAWDMSHLFKERKFSEFDDLPDIEKTPSFSAYDTFLKGEASKRGDESSVKMY